VDSFYSINDTKQEIQHNVSMSKKSSTCNGKKSGNPLTEYNSFEDAEEGADYANANYGSNLVPYLCQICNQWHLSPKDRQTEVVNSDDGYDCNCVGSDGTPKDLYRTQKDATQRAKCLYEDNGIRLQVYKCDETSMWHLTHQENSFSGSFSSKKSAVCFGRSGKALTEYGTCEDAKDGAEYAYGRYGGDVMIPYECPTCYKWHLKPSTSTGRSFLSQKSTMCFRRSGKALTEYETYEDAEDGAEYACGRYGGDEMIPYECPTCYKWHLKPC
jgi:hypothetical protein